MRFFQPFLSFVVLLALAACTTVPQSARVLRVSSRSVEAGVLPSRFAFCAPTVDGKAGFGDGGNHSPHIAWSQGPAGSRSYAVLMHDPDVPRDFWTLANKPGVDIPDNAPRVRFNHWVLVNIPDNIVSLPARADSLSVRKGGKPYGKAVNGLRGQNDYAKYLNDKMPTWSGQWGGYDGPCPPWNDKRLHRYVFTVYALDVPELKLRKGFRAEEALAAMKGHVLAQGSMTAYYSLHPAVRKTLVQGVDFSKNIQLMPGTGL
jgi:Raf kinase inhibitor-like YbhB/YbcL family protein